MRYTNGVYLTVPYMMPNEDGTTSMMRSRMNFSGNVDRRRVKRELRKWVKRNLERSLSVREQNLIMRNAQRK